MQSNAEDGWAPLRSSLTQGFDKATGVVDQANKALVDRGVNPLGGVALGVGAVSAALLLKHLLSQREDPARVYYR